jgi:hypothetical protein
MVRHRDHPTSPVRRRATRSARRGRRTPRPPRRGRRGAGTRRCPAPVRSTEELPVDAHAAAAVLVGRIQALRKPYRQPHGDVGQPHPHPPERATKLQQVLYGDDHRLGIVVTMEPYHLMSAPDFRGRHQPDFGPGVGGVPLGCGARLSNGRQPGRCSTTDVTGPSSRWAPAPRGRSGERGRRVVRFRRRSATGQ